MSRKLLLADDSITIQKVIGIIFAHEDYQMTIVDNGEAALTKAHAEQPDLVLADVFMPGKNGYEVCAAIKQDPRLKHIPVLLLTGTFEPFDEAKAKAAGADSWIPKPFESQALIDRVEELLARAAAAPSVPTPAAMVEPALVAGSAAVAAEADQWGESTTDGAIEMDTSLEGELWIEPAGAVEGLWKEPAAAGDDLWTEPADGDAWNQPATAAADAGMTAGAAEPWKESAGVADDLWGTIEAADGGDLEPMEQGADDWSGLTAEVDVAVTGAATPVEVAAPVAADEFTFEEAPAGDVFFPSPAPSAPAKAAWGVPAESPSEWAGFEEDILPLDESDIIEEEELEEIPPAAAYAKAEVGDDFSFDEEVPAASAAEYSFDDYAANAATTEEFVFGDTALSGETPTAEQILFEEESLVFGGETPAAAQPEWDGRDELIARPAPKESAAPAPAFTFETEPVAAAALAAVEPSAAGVISASAVEEQIASLSEAEVTRIVERVAAPVIERLAEAMLAKIAWEVVPDLAESMIRDEIRKIRESVAR